MRTHTFGLVARSAARTAMFLSTVPFLVALPLAAQSAGGNGRAPIDEAYTAKILEYTTEPFFLTPLVDQLPASDRVPTPLAVLGRVIGTPEHLHYPDEVRCSSMRCCIMAISAPAMRPARRARGRPTASDGATMADAAAPAHASGRCFFAVASSS